MSEISLATDEDLWRAADILEESHGRLTVEDFRLLQQALGMNFNRQGLLADRELRPHVPWCSITRFDPMHTYLSHGVFGEETGLILEWAGRVFAGDVWGRLELYCDGWHWPKYLEQAGKTSVKQLFKKTRKDSSRDAGYFKCAASEALAVYRIVDSWVEDELEQVMEEADQIESYHKLCKAIRAVQLAKHGKIGADVLREAIEGHLRAHWQAGCAAKARSMPLYGMTYIGSGIAGPSKVAGRHRYHSNLTMMRVLRAQM